MHNHVKSRAMKLFNDFLEKSEDREPGNDDKEDEGKSLNFQTRHKADRS